MKAGRLRERVTIQSVTETQNSIGEPIETWATFAVVWGAVEPLPGRDRYTAAQLEEPVVSRLRIRYLQGITAKMRVVHDGVTYAIRGAPMVDAKKKEVELLLESLPNG